MDTDDESFCIVTTESGFMRMWPDDLADVLGTIKGYVVIGRGLTRNEALSLVRITNSGVTIYGSPDNN